MGDISFECLNELTDSCDLPNSLLRVLDLGAISPSDKVPVFSAASVLGLVVLVVRVPAVTDDLSTLSEGESVRCAGRGFYKHQSRTDTMRGIERNIRGDPSCQIFLIQYHLYYRFLHLLYP